MIRKAQQGDLKFMVEMASLMAKEGAFRRISFNHEKTATFGLKRMFSDSGFAWVATDEDNIPVGMLIGQITPYIFSGDLIAVDDAWYMVPKMRGSIQGVKLLKQFVKWGLGKGAVEVCVGVSTGVNLPRTGKLLSRLGFTEVGGTFKLEA